MLARLRRATPPTRCLAAVTAALLLAAAVPTAAWAEEENPWKGWASSVTDRTYKAEIPLLIIVTLPAMLTVTPIWLGQLAYGKIKSAVASEEPEEGAEE